MEGGRNVRGVISGGGACREFVRCIGGSWERRWRGGPARYFVEYTSYFNGICSYGVALLKA